MSASRRSFTKEFKDTLCEEVINTSKPVVEVAKSYGVGPETLRRWLIKYRETHAGTPAVVSSAEAARLKALEKENQELRAEVSFLKKASAYFAREQR
jgi:transposase